MLHIYTRASFRRFAMIVALAGLLLLPSWTMEVVRAQDAKDALIEALKKKIEFQQKEIELLGMQRQAVEDRLRKEIDLLNKTVKDRETLLIKLETEIKKLAIDAKNSEVRAKILQERNEKMLEVLRANSGLSRPRGGGKPDRIVIDNPKELNPPSVIVNGKVQKVEGKYVEISLGTDHGLDKGHTLEVYRLQPEPMYVGRIRILDLDHHSSVARLVSTDNPAKLLKIKAGDLVTSKLNAKGGPNKKVAPPKENDLPRAKPEPPPVSINGVIEKVDAKDSTLVTISVGSDAGVTKDQILDVYRLKPEPKYLGKIRIVEVSAGKAVGLVRPPREGGIRPTLQAGDHVTSALVEKKKVD